MITRIQKIEEIERLASQLLTGIVDRHALSKFHWEKVELENAIILNDSLGAIMEAGDCVYYAIKSEVNNLISANDRDKFIESAASTVSLSVEILLDCVIAKMSLRATPWKTKDDEAERAAVTKILGFRIAIL